jgi:hypothetical protein
MVVVQDYMKFVTQEQMSSEKVKECDNPLDNTNTKWKGTSNNNGDLIQSDQCHDDIGYKKAGTSGTEHKGQCYPGGTPTSQINIENVMIRSAMPVIDNDPVIKHFIHDVELIPEPKNGSTTSHLRPFCSPGGRPWHYQNKNGNIVSYKYWNPNDTTTKDNYGNNIVETCDTETDTTKFGNFGKLYKMAFCNTNSGQRDVGTTKMGSPVFSNYMEMEVLNYINDKDKRPYSEKLYFHTITDCGPSIAPKTASTSNDIDSGGTPTERGFYYNELVPATENDPNIYTIGLNYTISNSIKHRALAQHMMIRILGEDAVVRSFFVNNSHPIYTNTKIGNIAKREKLINKEVSEIQKAVIALKPNPSTPIPQTGQQKIFLLQDLYSNWIWQLTLIHIFNIKYKIENTNIGSTTVETTHDESGTSAAGLQDKEREANLAAFFRLSRLTFYMGDGRRNYTAQLKCRVQKDTDYQNSDDPIPLNDKSSLDDYYQNVVNLFYKDFWKPLLNKTKPAPSQSWLTHATSKGWVDFNVSKLGVAGFMRHAFKQGDKKQDTKKKKVWFDGFVNKKLKNVSIHDSGYDDDKYKDEMRNVNCHANVLEPSCDLIQGKEAPGFLPFTNPTNQNEKKLPEQFYPHKAQFTNADGSEMKGDEVKNEQTVQILTVQMLKSFGDQSHLVDFIVKSEYLDNRSIRPILQIQDRPLEAISLRYLNMKTSNGIIICEGQKIFVDTYANNTIYNGCNYEVKRLRPGVQVTAKYRNYGHILEKITSPPTHSLISVNAHIVIAWTPDSKVNREPETARPTGYLETVLNYAGTRLANAHDVVGIDNNWLAYVAISAAAAIVGSSCSTLFTIVQGGGGIQKGGALKKKKLKPNWKTNKITNPQHELDDNKIIEIFQYELLAQEYIKFFNMQYRILDPPPTETSPLNDHINYIIAKIMMDPSVDVKKNCKAANEVKEWEIKNNTYKIWERCDMFSLYYTLTNTEPSDSENSTGLTIQGEDVYMDPVNYVYMDPVNYVYPYHKVLNMVEEEGEDEEKEEKGEEDEEKGEEVEEEYVKEPCDVEDFIKEIKKHENYNELVEEEVNKIQEHYNEFKEEVNKNIREVFTTTFLNFERLFPNKNLASTVKTNFDSVLEVLELDNIETEAPQGDGKFYARELENLANPWEFEEDQNGKKPKLVWNDLVSEIIKSGAVAVTAMESSPSKRQRANTPPLMRAASAVVVPRQPPLVRSNTVGVATQKRIHSRPTTPNHVRSAQPGPKKVHMQPGQGENMDDSDDSGVGEGMIEGGKLIRNKRSKKYKKTKRGKKSRRGKKSQKKKKVKCVKKSRKRRNTRRKRHHSKKL